MLLQHWKLRDWKGIKFKVRRPTLRVAFLANAVNFSPCLALLYTIAVKYSAE